MPLTPWGPLAPRCHTPTTRCFERNLWNFMKICLPQQANHGSGEVRGPAHRGPHLPWPRAGHGQPAAPTVPAASRPRGEERSRRLPGFPEDSALAPSRPRLLSRVPGSRRSSPPRHSLGTKRTGDLTRRACPLSWRASCLGCGCALPHLALAVSASQSLWAVVTEGSLALVPRSRLSLDPCPVSPLRTPLAHQPPALQEPSPGPRRPRHALSFSRGEAVQGIGTWSSPAHSSGRCLSVLPLLHSC